MIADGWPSGQAGSVGGQRALRCGIIGTRLDAFSETGLDVCTGEFPEVIVLFPLLEDEMAVMVGSVRDVVSRSLRVLELEGAIRIDGHRILVIAPQKLEKMVWA